MYSSYSEEEWEHHKNHLWCLWVKERRGMSSLVTEMAALGFNLSKRDYESHFRAWGFVQNIPKEAWKYIELKIEKRKREDKDSVAIVDGVLIPPKRLKKETSRHYYTRTEKITMPASPSPPAGPMTTVLASDTALHQHMLGRQYTFTNSVSQSQLQAPFSKLLNIVGWLTKTSPLSVTRLSNWFETWIPEKFLGEHILQAQRIMKSQYPDPVVSYLGLMVYMASNNHLDWQFDEVIFDQFMHSGILDQTLRPQHPFLREPVVKSFLEKILRFAVNTMHSKTLRWLLRLDVKLSKHLPLVLVSECGGEGRSSNMLDELLSSGSNPDEYCCQQHGTPMDYAAYRHDLFSLGTYVEHQRANRAQQPLNGRAFTSSPSTLSEVFLAIYTDDVPELAELQRGGFDFNVRNRWGMFPLGLAVFQDQYEVCEALLQMGASPNFDPSTIYDGDLPSGLHIAAAGGHWELCSLLLKHGANLHKPATQSTERHSKETNCYRQ
ncbi:hypothetical protein PG997_008904 [Apiospora hydei]|uniref:Clr5 domain-containing protein n=1 Tax=Apiospora hydei TaxID=1337664 RepID=A0ABR1WC62_9PEZI